MTFLIPVIEGDCHTSDVGLLFAMTWNSMVRTMERYRAAQGKNDYTYFAHDLAVGPADKFQFICFLRKADRH